MAYLEPVLYKQFYAITKEQLGNSSLNKWEDYGLIIEKEIFEKIKQFEPINANGSRITKNGRNIGIFENSRIKIKEIIYKIILMIICKLMAINKIMQESITITQAIRSIKFQLI